MTLTVRKSLERGTLLGWTMLIVALALAGGCTSATAPRYPQTDDSTKKDTVKTSLLVLPPVGPRV